jgi:putative hydrolase of the HAD superfamily
VRSSSSATPRWPAALLFDLDDTLVPEDKAHQGALVAAAELAADAYGLDRERVGAAVRPLARRLWRDAPIPADRRSTYGATDGLWCDYAAEGREARELRAWAPADRRRVWSSVLASFAIEDADLAAQLAQRFPHERRKRITAYPDAEPALRTASQRCRMAIVTNGPAALQREKLSVAALLGYFDGVIASGDVDVGVAKPNVRIFEIALQRLKTTDAVMVGNDPRSDVAGAQAAGLASVWIDRNGAAATIHTLEDLSAALTTVT